MVVSGTMASGAGAGKEYVPADGSWVAELEAAKAELAELKRSEGGLEQQRGASPANSSSNKGKRGEALKVHLRLCRAHSTLRQWEKLDGASQRALDHCSSYSSPRSAARVSEWTGRFQSYKDRARRELAVPTALNAPEMRDMLRSTIKDDVEADFVPWPNKTFPNSNVLQNAAIHGDVRLLEAVVAHGAAIDHPFLEGETGREVVAPNDATALVVACAVIAMNDLDPPHGADPAEVEGATRHTAECAMHLVRLGADPARRLHLRNAPGAARSKAYRVGGLDGKSALELARMSRRTDLVELMERHLRYTPQERAEVAHCRCGSRLPWRACHSTGVGQHPHYLEMKPYGTMYRVSPLARCPCKNTAKTHYRCCWIDTATPKYLIDTDGNHMYRQARRRPSGRFREVQDTYGLPDFEVTPAELTDFQMDAKAMVEMVRMSPVLVQAAFAEEGPKSQLLTWDLNVYAGCLERLETPFFWKDLHWKLDKPELLLRTKSWNEALQQYCDDAGLEGEERDRVVARHRANPCAPCGRVGCDAFEREVREFQRCSRCKTIAYCGRDCQKRDWAAHRKCCIG